MSMRYLFTNKNKAITFGIFFALLAAILESLVDVFPKPLMNNTSTQIGMDPLIITFLIYFVNGIVFTPFAMKNKTTRLERKSITMLVIIGLVEVSSTAFFLYGLRQTTAVNATIFLNSEIVFGIVLAMLFLGERLKRNETLPLTLICSGAIILPFINDVKTATLFSSFVIGDGYVLVTGMLLGVCTCLYKYLSGNMSLSRIMQYSSFTGAGASILMIFVLNVKFNVDLSQLPDVLFIGIFGIGLSAFCYMVALKYMGAVKTIIAFSSTTVFGVLLSNLVLAESVLPSDMASVGLIIVGTIILRNKVA